MADHPLTEVPILILGESHTAAISRAIEATPDAHSISIDVRPGSDKSKINFTLFDFYRPDKLVLAFGGTEHNIIGMIEGEPKFDFLWPPFDDFDQQRALVPASAIEEMLLMRMQGGLKRALRVREQFDCPAFALAPPPPFLEIDEKTTLPRAFSTLLEAGIAPAAIRRKLHAVQSAVMKALYEDQGITLIEAPRGASDADGFLLRKLWGRDPTHGNLHYGQLVIEHLGNRLGADAQGTGKQADV